MVFNLPVWKIYLLAIVHSVVSGGENQCPKPQNECKIRTSSERNVDYCGSIVAMLAGIDKANKGLYFMYFVFYDVYVVLDLFLVTFKEGATDIYILEIGNIYIYTHLYWLVKLSSDSKLTDLIKQI